METASSSETPGGTGCSEHTQNTWGTQTRRPDSVLHIRKLRRVEAKKRLPKVTHGESVADLGLKSESKQICHHPQLLRRADRLGIMLKLKTRPNSNRKKKPAPWTDSEVVLVWELRLLGSGAGPDPPFSMDTGKSIPFSGPQVPMYKMKRLMISKGCLSSKNLSYFGPQFPHSRGRMLHFQGFCENHVMSRRSSLEQLCDGNLRNSVPITPTPATSRCWP